MPDIIPTELLDISVVRQDGVKQPASGFPILLMKSAAEKAVNAVGGIDEKPDIAGATGVLQAIARLIQSEAAEMAVGATGELHDIQTLCEAASLISYFRSNEMWGDEDDGETLKGAGLVFKAHRKFSSDERTSLASEGNALPDGSYPIPDEDALHRAVTLARSGHGDVAAARRLIAKRAKELKVPNPLAGDTKKDAHEGTDLPGVRTADGDVPGAPEARAAAEGVTKTSGEPAPVQGAAAPEGDAATQIEKAVAEATKASEERMKALEAEVAKMRSTPLPGGPMLAPTAAQRDEREKAGNLAKAAHFRSLADKVQDRQLARYYREQAAAAETAVQA